MIQALTSLDEYMDFIQDVNSDPLFHEPMLSSQEQFQHHLADAITEPNKDVFAAFDGDGLTGIFSFVTTPADRNVEMLVGLSRREDAYKEMLARLREKYPGYRADFVFNPRNPLLTGLLRSEGAVFYTEVLKFRLKKEVPFTGSQQVELYSPKYHDQYVAMHDDSDRFWTAGKVIAAPDRFRIILAVENGQAVAYADVTHKYEENELYDIFVKEEYRRRGFGRAMLAKAIELNRPKDLMLLVDGDDGPAIALCKSLGFVQVLGEESVTAYMTL